MNLLLSDPVLQTCLVGMTVNAVAGAVSFYLWRESQHERYLLLWALGWSTSAIRWIIHYPAEADAGLRVVEGLLISVVLSLLALGSYDLLPAKRWQSGRIAWVLAGILAISLVGATLLQLVIEFSYTLFVAMLFFSVWCLWRGYRATRMTGYAIAGVAYATQGILTLVLLLALGRAVGNIVLVPLFNTVVATSFVLIAYQRIRSQHIAAERTIQEIFDTAPIPLAISRAHGDIERANRLALDLMSPPIEPSASGTALDSGLVADSISRHDIYDELNAGRSVVGRELASGVGGAGRRMFAVNAARVALDDGPRYIFAFYELTLIDMRALVTAVLADLDAATPTQARIDIGQLPAAVGDVSLVSQVWQNLIGNALKFSGKAPRPRIEIGGSTVGGVTEYFVRDNGAGFDMAYAERLFEVFQRLHASDEFEGTGIGLAIVQRIVQRHGGSVRAEGAPGQGAALYFTLG